MDINLWDALRRHPGVKLKPIASEEDIAFSEQILGFRLPDILRSFYREVANGGGIPEVGESYGAHIFGVRGGSNYDENVIHDYYRHCMMYDMDYLYFFRGTLRRGWPEGLVPVGFWGGAAGEFSICLDCSQPEMPLYFFEAASVTANPNYPVPLTYFYGSFTTFVHTLLTVEYPWQYVEGLVVADNMAIVARIKQFGFENLALIDPVSEGTKIIEYDGYAEVEDPFNE